MLADLIPHILKTRMPQRIAGAAERQRRWVSKNRAAFNAYRREWRKRKAA